MTNERRSTHDIKILSAFLDNALNTSQQEKLQTRLAQEPELRQKLENLRRTKTMLANLPRVKSPRNFTLTPDMVTARKPQGSPFFTTLKLATSFAAILLVTLFGFELLMGSGLMATRLASEAPAIESMRSVEDTDTVPQPLIQWGATGGEVAGKGGGSDVHYGMGSETFMAEEIAVEAEALPPEEMMEIMPIEESPADGYPADGYPADGYPADGYPAEEMPAEEQPEQEMVLPEAEESIGMTAIEEAPAEEDLILGINLDQSGEIISKSSPAGYQEASKFERTNLLRWSQIVLAVIVLAGVIALFILRSRRSSQMRKPN
jgi:hypothetical protein